MFFKSRMVFAVVTLSLVACAESQDASTQGSQGSELSAANRVGAAAAGAGAVAVPEVDRDHAGIHIVCPVPGEALPISGDHTFLDRPATAPVSAPAGAPLVRPVPCFSGTPDGEREAWLCGALGLGGSKPGELGEHPSLPVGGPAGAPIGGPAGAPVGGPAGAPAGAGALDAAGAPPALACVAVPTIGARPDAAPPAAPVKLVICRADRPSFAGGKPAIVGDAPALPEIRVISLSCMVAPPAGIERAYH